jgi:hypothetical protein
MSASIIVAFITGVLGPVLLLFIKSKLEKKTEKPDMVLETLKVSELVMTKLEHIKEEYKSDRVWITQFHNGGNFYPTGKSIAKFSIMYEVVGAGIQSVQSNFSNIPVNLFSRSINQLLEYETIEIPDYKDETVATYGLKYIAEDTGCKSGYLFAIKTIEGKFIGTLGLDYTKRKTKLDNDSINDLEHQSALIGGVLMTHLQQ